jgi:hypothetical protein
LKQHSESTGKLRTDKVGYMHALTGVVYALTQPNPRVLVKCGMRHKAEARESNRPDNRTALSGSRKWDAVYRDSAKGQRCASLLGFESRLGADRPSQCGCSLKGGRCGRCWPPGDSIMPFSEFSKSKLIL